MNSIHDLATAVGAELEAARLAALRGLEVLDSVPEAAFDDLVWLAARLCDTPIALTTLVDSDRQWFKARYGLDLGQTPRDLSFCSHAIQTPSVMVVQDALLDPRFAGNALVVGPPYMRFYAGAPLVGEDGHHYGTLCVIDTRPRELGAVQLEGLERLARRAVDNLQARRRQRLAEAREQTLQRLLEAMPDGVVTCSADGHLEAFNRQARQWHGVDPRFVPGDRWADYFGLYAADGSTPLPLQEVPLMRALQGEVIRDLEMEIRTAGQPRRRVLCYADQLTGTDGRRLGAICVMRDVTAEHAARAQARIEARRFYDAFHRASQGMALVALDGRWMEVNDALCANLGYRRDELMALDFQSITHPDDLAADLALLQDILHGTGNGYQVDKRYLHRSGRVLHAHLSVSVVRDAAGHPLHLVSQIHDFTQQWLAEQAVRESEARLRAIADNVPALIARVGADLRYEFVNRAYAGWFGHAPEAVIGKHLSEVLDPQHYRELRGRLDEVLSGQEVSFDIDVQAAEGPRYMHVNYFPTGQGEGGRATGFHITAHDISAQVLLSRDLEARAFTDVLTGLPNRAAWMVRLDQAIRRAREQATDLAILFLDLDDFKRVNDRYGHHVGDEVLRAVALRLRAALRPDDFLTRLSGDEFLVCLASGADGEADAARLAGRMMEAMKSPLAVSGHRLRVTPSIGVAVQRGPDIDGAVLMQQADAAMYAQKRRQAGKGAALRVVR